MMELLHFLSGGWVELMWRTTWQGGIFIAVILLITKILRRLSPTIRHLLWMLVVVKFLVMPFVMVPITLPELPIVIREPIVEPIVETPDLPPETEVIPESSPALLTEQLPPVAEMSRPRIAVHWPSLLFSSWVFGVLLLLMGIIYRSLKLKRDIVAAKVLEDSTVLQIVAEGAKELRIKPPLLKISDKFKSPLASGIFHPTLIFPEHIIEKFSQSELRAIIHHELAHIKRLDILTNWFQIITQVFYFFNPLIWYVNRQIRLEREQACDDWVLQTGKEDRKAYVDALVKVVELCSKHKGLALGIVGVSEPFTLMARRLKMIMDAGRNISTRLSVRVIIGLVVIGVLGIPACVTKESQEDIKELILHQLERSQELVKTEISEFKLNFEVAPWVQLEFYDPLTNEPVALEGGNEIPRMKYSVNKCMRRGNNLYLEKRSLSKEEGEIIEVEKISFDGKRVRAWDSKTNEGVTRVDQSIMPGGTLPKITPYVFYGTTSVGTPIAGTLGTKTVELLGVERVNGIDCYVLRSNHPGNSLDLKLWVDLVNGCRIVKREELTGDVVSKRYEVLKWKKIPGGIWFPIKGVIREFNIIEGPDFQKQASLYEMHVDPKTVSVNTVIHDDVFKIEFPVGAKVWDDTTHEKSRIRTGEEALAPEAMQTSSIPDIVEKVSPSIVSIRSADERAKSYGSGIIISPEGFILTCRSVIYNKESFVVALQERGEVRRMILNKKIIGVNARSGLAVLKIDSPVALPYAKLGDSEKARVGDSILALGDDGIPPALSITAGIINAKRRNVPFGTIFMDAIQVDAHMPSRGRGGALVNTKGEVIGVLAEQAVEGVTYAISINSVKPVIDALIKHGKVPRGWLGISTRDITSKDAESFGLPNLNGALVTAVLPNSPAEKARFKSGDVIKDFHGKKIKSAHELSTLIAQEAPGQRVKVSVVRDKAVRRKRGNVIRFKLIEVEIGEMPRSGRGNAYEKERLGAVEEIGGQGRIRGKAQKVVSVHFENAHISTVLRTLAEMSGVNIVLDESVFSEDEEVIEGGISPRITIDLKDLPLMTVLTFILRAKHLVYRMEENLIWITRPARMVSVGTTRVEREPGEEISAAEMRLEKKAGQLVSITYDKAHLRTVLRHLTKLSGIDIVLDENVFPNPKDPKAGVTIGVKDIPLIEALDVILRSKGLKYEIHPNLVWVTTAERIRKRKEEEKLREKIKEAQGVVNPELREKLQKIVSLHFENAHIRSVLRYLSEVSGVNIVLDEAVLSKDGKVIEGRISPLVTIDLMPLPLTQALAIILRAKHLIYRIEENLIWITRPARMVPVGTTRVEREPGEEITAAELRLERKARQLVSISYDKAHLRTVLRHLSKLSGIDIVLDENVFPVEDKEMSPAARITVHLKDVPLIQALDVILRSKGLSYRLEENTIWITTRETDSKEPVVAGLTFQELKEGISKREVLGLLGEPTTHASGLVGAAEAGNRMREHIVEKGAVETWCYSKPGLPQILYIYFDKEGKLVSTSIEVTQPRIAQYSSERTTTMSDLRQLGLGLYMYQDDFNISVLPDEYEQLLPNYITEDVIRRIRSELTFLELSKDEIEKDTLIKVKDKYGSLHLLYSDGHIDLVGPK